MHSKLIGRPQRRLLAPVDRGKGGVVSDRPEQEPSAGRAPEGGRQDRGYFADSRGREPSGKQGSVAALESSRFGETGRRIVTPRAR
jgi:hypothetical protein